jgi:hypothetical protein
MAKSKFPSCFRIFPNYFIRKSKLYSESPATGTLLLYCQYSCPFIFAIVRGLYAWMRNWACGSYYNFIDRGLVLTGKLLSQGFLLVKLKSLLRKFYGRHYDLVNRYGISVSQMTTDMFHLS